MRCLCKLILVALFMAAAAAKGSDYPYGGTCDPISREKVQSIASIVLKGAKFRSSKNQQVCTHNIEIVTEEGASYLKISTRRGDGMGNMGTASEGTNDIKTARRRFELQSFSDDFPTGKTLIVSYDFRVDPEHEFIEDQGYAIVVGQVFQIMERDGRWDTQPLFIYGRLDPSGYKVFGVPAQKSTDFGKWVTIKFELPMLVSLQPRVKIWVDGQVQYDGNALFSIKLRGQPSYVEDTTFALKIGLYQYGLSPENLKSQAVQVINIRNFSYVLIDKDIQDDWVFTTAEPKAPKAFCYNKATNRAARAALGRCEAGYVGITLEEYTKWKKENKSATSKTKEKKTHCYYPDTNTLEKSRYCPGKLVTLKEGEALVKQGN